MRERNSLVAIRSFTVMILGLFVLSPSISFAQEKTKEDKQSFITDYGVHGHLFDIAEPSIIEEIMEKLKIAKENGTLEQLQQEFTKKATSKVLNPTPVQNIKKAEINRSWTYNPSYTQHTDITDDKGRMIVKAGTTVNALEKLQWGEPLVFIDGTDEDQVKWAQKVTGKIVLTKGAPIALSKQIKRPVYFDQGGIMCHRFKIEAVPAIIEQEKLLLKIREVKI
ncbi:MAG: type-F conjugative transfer system protein TraW [Rickettsiaceae bacterium]|nr:type-F conjugative transfer system protein TraW [Rickettsiaceae bacterium]